MEAVATEKETTVAPSNKAEVGKVVGILKNAPEINVKVEYYKSILKAQDILITAIENKIARTNEIVIYWLFRIIPIIRVVRISDYDRAKLLMEKIEAENQMFYQKQYFENWLERKKEYEVYFDRLSAEVNEHFETVFNQAKDVAKGNMRLASAINKFLTSNDNDDQSLRNEFYLYLKQEIKNKLEHKK